MGRLRAGGGRPLFWRNSRPRREGHMNRFRFRSTLPPERIPELMAKRLERSQIQDGVQSRIFVEWDNGRFTVFHTEQQGFTPKDGWQRTRRGYAKGHGRSWNLANPFRGTLRPDDQGGSILEGRFVNHPMGKWIILACMAIVSASCYARTRSVPGVILCLAGMGLLVLFFGRNKHRSESAEKILASMREIFTEEVP